MDVLYQILQQTASATSIYTQSLFGSTVARVTPDGELSTFIEEMNGTGGLEVDEDGNMNRVTPGGDVSIFATDLESANGSDFDSRGNLYVADYEGNAIRKIEPDGTVSTFAGDLNGPGGVYVDQEDNVIVGLFGVNFSGDAATVLKITPEGTVSELATGGGSE